MSGISVLVVDDDQLVACALAALCQRTPGINVVGVAYDGREGLQQIERHQPMLALVDVLMPNLNGIELARQVKKALYQTKLIVVTGHSDPEYCFESFRAGVDGYLLKASAMEELEVAIKSVIRGKRYITPEIAHLFLDSDQLPSTNLAQPRLTGRQREILQLVAEGKTNKEVAAILGTATKTVENQRAELMHRLGVHGSAELLRRAIQFKFIKAY